jgi:hypothetical protein
MNHSAAVVSQEVLTGRSGRKGTTTIVRKGGYGTLDSLLCERQRRSGLACICLHTRTLTFLRSRPKQNKHTQLDAGHVGLIKRIGRRFPISLSIKYRIRYESPISVTVS